MKRSAAIVLLFALIGPLIGSVSHAVLLVLLEPRAISREDLSFVSSLVAISYATGLLPALIVGIAVAWRNRQSARATLPFALTVSILAPVTSVALVGVIWSIVSGNPLADVDIAWRKRQLHDAATTVALLTIHSIVATTGCWVLARNRRLV